MVRIVIPSIEIKYLEQDMVWKHIDCFWMARKLAYATQSQYSLKLALLLRERTQFEGCT